MKRILKTIIYQFDDEPENVDYIVEDTITFLEKKLAVTQPTDKFWERGGPVQKMQCEIYFQKSNTDFSLKMYWDIFDSANDCMEAIMKSAPDFLIFDLLEYNFNRMTQSGLILFNSALKIISPDRLLLLTAYPDEIPEEIEKKLGHERIREKMTFNEVICSPIVDFLFSYIEDAES